MKIFSPINLILFLAFMMMAINAYAQPQAINLKAMLFDHNKSIPFPKVNITNTPGPNAPTEGIICESQVDDYSGEANCYINNNICQKDSPLRVKYTVNFSEEEFYIPDPSRHIDVFVRGCSFVTPPESHTVTYQHSRHHRYNTQLAYLNKLLQKQHGKDINDILMVLVSDTESTLTKGSIGLELSPLETVRASLEASSSDYKLAQRYPNDSPYRKAFLTRSANFQHFSVQISNTVLKHSIEPVIQTNADIGPQKETIEFASGFQLKDYYNNINLLQNKQALIHSQILFGLPAEDAKPIISSISSLANKKELDSAAVDNLEQLVSLLQQQNIQ
ncbi:hypothetical protein ACWXWU_20460 [Shewanella sp. A14]